ncbi:MAG TPA: acyl-CoA dehydrogenase family protein [Candidatus Limnocylindrales bacterium]|nr:acyl-CoA dehydrogenase family protein [Candidatus Limnocylindrales bacterium]
MTMTTETTTKTDWLGKAKELATDFATRAPKHDADDSFVAENYAAMKTAKLFSAPIPAELGGGGATFAEHAAIIRTIARGCGSTGLAFSMHSHLLQATIWRHRHNATPPAEPLLRRIAKEELILVSTGGSDWLDGSGALTKGDDGNYKFSGRKIFGSGGPSGDLLLTTGIYDDPQSGPTVYHFGVSMKDPGVKVQDNWKTLGMRGTGSNDITIENVAVADAGVSVRRPKGAWHRFFDVVSPIIWPLTYSAYVGVAENAHDIALAMAPKRKDDAVTQDGVGEMRTQLLIAQETLERMISVAASEYEPSMALSDLTYRRKTAVAKAALRTVELAMEVAGGAGFYRAAGLERCFRDIQGARYHPWQERKQYRFSGRIALGLDPV